jgi:hypothetical protein
MGTEEPDAYLAYLDIDIGVSSDWPFLVRMAEKKMLDAYVIADGRAVKVEPHCGLRTFRTEGAGRGKSKQRFNIDGEPHECKNKVRKK